MSEYICKFCRNPIKMDFMSEKMMEFMDVPEDSGAHAECLEIDTKGRANTKPKRKLATPESKEEQDG